MVNSLRRGIFLDRDGVLNRLVADDSGSDRAPWTVNEVEVFGHQLAAVQRLALQGWTLVVVTNQPDVSRGFLTEAKAREINEVVMNRFPDIEASYICIHTGADCCSCRKPLPGMLLQASDELGIDTSRSWMVGDRWVDIAAGATVGCRTILIDGLKSWLSTSHGTVPADIVPDFVAVDLTQAAGLILRSSSEVPGD